MGFKITASLTRFVGAYPSKPCDFFPSKDQTCKCRGLEVDEDQKSETGKQTPAGSGPHDHRVKEEVVQEDEVVADCVQIGVASRFNGGYVPEYVALVRTSGRLLPNDAHLAMAQP